MDADDAAHLAGHIAVVGIACRFPGASTPDEFWDVIRGGREPVTFFTEAELRSAGTPERMLTDPDYVPAQGTIDDEDQFDAEFFGINPVEAGMMDPQHRLLLESAWTALENAGHDPHRVPGPVGVFAGAYRNDHLGLVDTPDEATAFARNIANETDYLATRVSYKLNLHGPAVTVQTACSTSLVAVHLACQSLRTGESRTALAGGVTLRSGQPRGYLYQRGGILSPDGHCRPFDADAEGTVIGDGVGMVVLKRLSDAIADGDTVHALVLGSAAGNDGAERVGFTAPGVAGQARVIGAALRAARVQPSSLGYVETHGSGTALGDRIEVDALTRAFKERGWTSGTCRIGSVKSNIGHTHAASGIAGFIKTVLSLRHRTIAPTLHFRDPNPRIDWASTPFRVAVEESRWDQGAAPLRAGVSSFGLGGTGVHVVLQEAPLPRPTDDTGTPQVLPLSARSPEALHSARSRLAEHFGEDRGQRLADVAYTLQEGRTPFEHRLAVVGPDPVRALRDDDPAKVLHGTISGKSPSVTFLFPGLGDQYPGMGRGLFETEPVFAAALQECDRLMRRHNRSLLASLYPADTATPATSRTGLMRMLGRGTDGPELRETGLAQPTVFAVEYALAKLWSSRGVRPDALIGYSLGEYVAACVAGVLDLDDAIALVCARADLIAGLPPGAMLAVPLPSTAIAEHLGDDLSLAAVNGPELCVVAGPTAAVEDLAARLAEQEVATRPLLTSHAFHSHMMEPIVEQFTELAGSITFHAPKIPYASNVTGDRITDVDATDPSYYARHLRQPVRFIEGLHAVRGEVLLEVGPGRALGGLAMQNRDPEQNVRAFASLPAGFDARPAAEVLATATAELWLAGVPIDWSATHHHRRRRVPVPAYPFQGRRYGVSAPAPRRSPADSVPELGRKPDLADWVSVPVWQPAVLGEVVAREPKKVLLFAGDSALSGELAAGLAQYGDDVVVVPPGTDDFRSLIEPQWTPELLVHARLVTAEPVSPDEAQRLGLHGLIAVAKSLTVHDGLDVAVLTSNAHPVGHGAAQPVKATALGPCLVWPLEVPGVRCRAIDVGPHDRVALLAELTAQWPDDEQVALRGGRRWRRERQPLKLTAGNASLLRRGGVYLITGGTGGIGRTLARYLIDEWKATVVLASRSGTSPEVPEGAETHQVDVTDGAQVRELVRDVVARHGALHGVVHAAGVPGGGLMALKDPDAADVVLAPKVAGTLALQAACADVGLDFLVLCSSLIAVTGGAGQVDYSAANAFLEAAAEEAAATGGPLTLTVDWDAWREVGMSVDAVGPRPHPTGHPLLTHRISDSMYSGRFSARSSWLVDEHRMLDMPVVPGAGHLELVRAAVADSHGQDPVGYGDITFYTPVVAGEQESTEVRVVLGELDETTGEVPFDVVSAYTDAAGASCWQRNSAGTAHLGEPAPAPVHDLDALVHGASLVVPDDLGAVGPMSFGPRSRCLVSMRGGDREFAALLRLPDEFAHETHELPLHPSLLDIATAFVGLFTAEEFRIPLSYGRVKVSGPLRGEVLSHQLHRVRDDGERQTVSADLTVMATDGTELLRIENFVLKKAGDLRRRLVGARDGVPQEVVPYALPRTGGPAVGFLSQQLAEGIEPAEGVEVFERLLAHRVSPVATVCTQDLAAVLAQARRTVQVPEVSTTALTARHPRPRLGTPYVEPSDDLCRSLAELWQDLLGMESVGMHDDFFDLGGHSLLGIQLAARLRNEFGLDVPLDSLFEGLTVARLRDRVGASST
ncbi:type I polyketide synthase [Saccharopolyspora gloriosae]|uniref:type I polyketide synthase n=1 Tax=Saccharopolyspora gloriosae TaxID=455344 RepID=UPI001FB6566D|nr:type I polyketide synthase [Saccharopolyspora gloriosae]